MKPNTTLAGCVALFLASCTGAGQNGKVRSQSKVDLSRYMGSWRVIACMDNKLERNFVDALETYRLRGSNRVDVHFEWRDKSFSAPVKTHDFTGKVVADGSNARWRMRLFPLFTASYIIVKVSPDYTRAAVAHPSKKFGWILARSRSLSEPHYQEMLDALEQEGLDPGKFIRVPQGRYGLKRQAAHAAVH